METLPTPPSAVTSSALARAMDAFSVNVARRDSLIAPLTEFGVNVVVVATDDLADQVEAATSGAAIKLAIDVVGGGATARLADCLADGGTAVHYEFLSGDPCQVTPDQLILRGRTLKSFWLAPKLGTMKPVKIRSLYDHLVQLFADGTPSVPVEAIYTIDQVRDALSHAMREGRDGKILITANRPIG